MFATVAIMALCKLESPTQEGILSKVEGRERKDRLECSSVGGELDVSVKCNTRSIYHLLCRAFGQCVAIS